MEADYKGKARNPSSYKFTHTTRRNEDRKDEFGSGINYICIKYGGPSISVLVCLLIDLQDDA